VRYPSDNRAAVAAVPGRGSYGPRKPTPQSRSTRHDHHRLCWSALLARVLAPAF